MSRTPRNRRTLRAAYAVPRKAGLSRTVVVVTDGYVGDDMQVLGYVKKHRGEARMFPFGVGNSVNRFKTRRSVSAYAANDYAASRRNTERFFIASDKR